MSTLGPRLSSELDELLRPYNLSRRRLWTSLTRTDVFRLIYPHLLVHTYHYVKYSCPLMEDARTSIECKDSLARYLADHIEEESGHEQWLLGDLVRLGLPQSIVLTTPATPSVAALVGSQLYALREMGPASILGYIYALEAYPPSVAFLKSLSQDSGIPESAMYTFMEHGDVDITHREELIEFVNGDWLQDDDRESVLYSAKLAAINVLGLFRELAERTDVNLVPMKREVLCQEEV